MSELLSYPLSENHPDRLRTPSGLRYEDLTLEALTEGRAGMEDLRVTAAALRMQAGIARAPGRATRDQLEQLAARLERDYGALRTAALIREAAEATPETRADPD